MEENNKLEYRVEGLGCANCALKIEKRLSDLPEIEKAYVNFVNQKITIIKSGYKNIIDEKIKKIVTDIEPGVDIIRNKESNNSIQKFLINNYSSIEQKIIEQLNVIDNVIKVSINKDIDTLVIEGNIDNKKEIKNVLNKLKLKYSIDYKEIGNKEEKADYLVKNTKKIKRLAAGVIIYIIGLLLFEGSYINKLSFILPFYSMWLIYGLSYVLIGKKVLITAYKNILNGQIFDENFLMVTATIGAFAIGEYPEAVAVMLFYMVGDMLQEKALQSSRKSIKELMNIKPEYANIKENGKIYKVDPGKVHINDIIIVKPGEKIPLDGIVKSGESLLDKSALTGESKLEKTKVNSQVLSGSINKTGLLEIEVKKEFRDSTVSKILKLIEESSEKKAPAEKFITKFAKYYTPIIVFSALFIALIPPLFISNALFSDWIYRALIFLVVSCPCALVISIPLGFFGGIGSSSKRGILVKGGNYLDSLNNVNQIVFDKTGTLTEGKFTVDKVKTFNNYSKEYLLELAAYVEFNSIHPISEAIIKKYGNEININSIKKYEEISGKGVKAFIDGKEVIAGNDKMMSHLNIGIDKVVNEINDTIIYIAVNGELAGLITINDKIKSDSKKTIKKLHEMSIKNIAMLTGDKESVAKKIADELGIDNYYSEILPHDKVSEVEKLLKKQDKKDKLAFVGDGINDAPVLARSDIGIAMGGLGSDAAIEAADIVIMTDEPSKIIDSLNIAKKTRKIVWQNIILALGIKGIVLILGVFGLATMWEAVFADVGVALLAIINSTRVIK